MSQERLFQFFEEELAYLASAGPRFARRHPERAALVSLDNVTSRDPDVERLVQAFAFLSGQVRAELHDELPQLTHTLLDLLWPQYLRPVPSTAVVEFRPNLAQLAGLLRIPAHQGTVESVPITSPETGRDFVCRFRTAYDLDLLPLTLVNAEVQRRPTHSELILSFEVGPAADPARGWDRVRIHVAGDPLVGLDIRHWLLRRSEQARIVAEITPPEGPKRTTSLGPFEPVGLLSNEALLDSGRLSFPGYRLVQEYFLARHKFLFVDSTGWNRLGPLEAESRIRVVIPLSEHPPERLKISTETLKLHCTPVVNLFQSAAVPIRYDGRAVEYEVLAEHDAQAVAVQRIQRVVGQPHGQTGLVHYTHFLDFKTRPGAEENFYHVTVRSGTDGRPVWKIMLSRPGSLVPPQILSIDLECSNGELASALLPGDIRFRGEGIPDLVEVRSLTQPEPIYQPPLESASPWRFISLLATNYLSLEDVETLTGVLKLYDWTPTSANWRRLQGIKSLTSNPGTTIVDGIPLRGRDLFVDLDPAHFANVGDTVLFSEVLHHFLALYANTNSYTRLSARLTSGSTYRWPALNGKQRPI